MSKGQVNRKNLKVVEGKKVSARSSHQSDELPSASAPSHGQRSTPIAPDVAELTTAMLFWPLDVMRWWMPTRTGT